MRVPIGFPQSGPHSSTSPTSSAPSPIINSRPSIPDLLKRYPVNLSKYEQFRAYLHQNPELSTQEKNTAAFVVVHLSLLGVYEIHEHIGGHGVAAVLKNGPGRTVLLRADMDALPVKEETGLPYASKVEMIDWDGVKKPVMHACGHDTHVTSLLGAGERLASMRDQWSGTVILLFQPDEERSGGAQRMVEDGLYDIIPVPDILLGQHVGAQRSGRIGMNPGVQLSASDSLKVTLHGRGGHASAPNVTVDPIVMMASCIIRLQTIVSREIDPGHEVAVVTVAQASAGDAANIIPSTATFQINVRTIDEDVRARVLASIDRIINAESEASNAPQKPTIELLSTFPVTYNSPNITKILSSTFSNVFGEEFRPKDFPRVNGSEDFPMLAKAVSKPYCFWFVGGTNAKLFDESDPRQIPSNHSPYFAPTMEMLGVGIDAMTSAALTFLR